MKKYLFLLVVIPCFAVVNLGCGRSSENTVIEGEDVVTPEMISQEEEELETTE